MRIIRCRYIARNGELRTQKQRRQSFVLHRSGYRIIGFTKGSNRTIRQRCFILLSPLVYRFTVGVMIGIFNIFLFNVIIHL